MAPQNNYYTNEIRSLRAKNEELALENARLKAALEKANENKENFDNIEAITKKIQDELWIEKRNQIAALEKAHREEIAAYKKENADLKKENAAFKNKIQFQEERNQKWRQIGDITVGPARVHQQKRELEAKVNRLEAKVRQLEAKARDNAQMVEDQTNLDLLCAKLHNALGEKEETINALSLKVKELQLLSGGLYNKIRKLESEAVNRDCVLYRFMLDKIKKTLDTYHLPDIVPILRKMMIDGHISMIIRVDKNNYDLVVSSGISSGIPQWMYFENIAKVLGIDSNKMLLTMPINGNHYSVFQTNQAPVHISL